MVSIPTSRLKDDRYYTPVGVVDQFWEMFSQPEEEHGNYLAERILNPRPRILDPSAGHGVFPMCARKHFTHGRYTLVEKDDRGPTVQALNKHVELIEAGGGEAELITGSLFDQTFDREYDIIATNPPFGLLEKYLDTCRPLLSRTGFLVFLLRTEWGQSGAGNRILERHFPSRKWQITGGRTSFRADGQTDTGEYSWWFWDRYNPNPRTLSVEYLPPLSESKARRWKRHVPGSEVLLPTRRRV